MDHKGVKKMKKRKDLDKLIGNGRKHFRKKSGHMLLRTESQSSISSDDIDHLSRVRYRRSRCSCFLTYGNLCLTICLLILCCVLIVFVHMLRSDLSSLQREIHSAPDNEVGKSHELQKMYSRLQSLRIHIQHISLNLTQHEAYSQQTSRKLVVLENEVKYFRKYKLLFGSLTNVPARLNELKAKTTDQSKMMTGFKIGLSNTNNRVEKLAKDLSLIIKTRKADVKDSKHSIGNLTTSNLSTRMDYTASHVHHLQSNVSELTHRVNVIEQRLNNTKLDTSRKMIGENVSLISPNVFQKLQKQSVLLKKRLNQLVNRFESYVSNATEANVLLRKQVNHEIKQESQGQLHSNLNDTLPKTSELNHVRVVLAVRSLNASLQHLLKNIPDVRLTLGSGVDNSTFSPELLGKGVILTRDEYFMSRKAWAKATNAFVLSIQSMQRMNVLKENFTKLKQVIDNFKNNRVLEASGLRPTEHPVNKNRSDMEVKAPVQNFTVAPDSIAPFSLPWVKTVGDAETIFTRWNKNGDDVISGDELDLKTLRGLMGSHTPSKKQLMHFDVNHDGRLTKKEVLCLFGFIAWPCTGKVRHLIKPTAASPAASQNSHSATASAVPLNRTSSLSSSTGTNASIPSPLIAHDSGHSVVHDAGNFSVGDKITATQIPRHKSIKITSQIPKAFSTSSSFPVDSQAKQKSSQAKTPVKEEKSGGPSSQLGKSGVKSSKRTVSKRSPP